MTNRVSQVRPRSVLETLVEGEHEESDVVSKVSLDCGCISMFFLGATPPPSFSFADDATHSDTVDRSCHAGRRVKNSSAVFTGGLR